MRTSLLNQQTPLLNPLNASVAGSATRLVKHIDPTQTYLESERAAIQDLFRGVRLGSG